MSPRVWALRITYTILGLPDYNHSIILNAACRPPRPGRMLGGRHDARFGAFAFAGYRGAASAG